MIISAGHNNPFRKNPSLLKLKQECKNPPLQETHNICSNTWTTCLQTIHLYYQTGESLVKKKKLNKEKKHLTNASEWISQFWRVKTDPQAWRNCSSAHLHMCICRCQSHDFLFTEPRGMSASFPSERKKKVDLGISWNSSRSGATGRETMKTEDQEEWRGGFTLNSKEKWKR